MIRPRRAFGIVLCVAAATSTFTGVASAQTMWPTPATTPVPPPPTSPVPPPPASPVPPPPLLDPELPRPVLRPRPPRGVTPGRLLAGGLAGSLLGFGVGHAIVREYGSIGWFFTASESVALMSIIIGGVASEPDSGSGALVIGALALAVLRLVEMVDVWTRPDIR